MSASRMPTVAPPGERQGEVDGGRALADAALPEATAMMFLTPAEA